MMRYATTMTVIMCGFLIFSSCSGKGDAKSHCPPVIHTLSAAPPVVKPGCAVDVTAYVGCVGEGTTYTWSASDGRMLTEGGATSRIQAPYLEETGGSTTMSIKLVITNPDGREAHGIIGVIVSRQLGGECLD